MKGIVLAGGTATRLFPSTKSISKQLLPIYDKPMVYYPLSVLMLAGIREVLLISTPRDISAYEALLGNGLNFGISIEYKIQEKPRGLADAFRVGKEFIGSDRVALVLGDNVFFGYGFSGILERAAAKEVGATIFGYYVNNPTVYGVVEFGADGKAVSIEEKPLKPKSNYAVPGLYFFDNEVVAVAKDVIPSTRGEIEITSVIEAYLKRGKLSVEKLGRGFAWLDTGTPEGLLEASNFIETIQKRQGLYVACLEEIAFNKGWIDADQLKRLSADMPGTDYGRYLRSIVEG